MTTAQKGLMILLALFKRDDIERLPTITDPIQRMEILDRIDRNKRLLELLQE